MLGNFELKQTVGRLYTGGEICPHPSKLKIYSPLNNRVFCLDLDSNISSLLKYEGRATTKRLCVCCEGKRILISDSKDRLYLYDFLSDRTIGSKKFNEPISHLLFSHNNKLFFVASGRFIFVYETPTAGSGVLLEPFLLVKKFNSKATEAIKALILTSDDRYFIYAADDHVVRICSILPFKQNAKTFDLVGHKSDILDIKAELEEREALISFDKKGLFLVWRLVEDKQIHINFSRSGKRIKTSEATSEIIPSQNALLADKSNFPLTEKQNQGQLQNESEFDLFAEKNLSALEFKMERSKFILHSKHSLYQEGTSIARFVFHGHLLLIGFANGTCSLYTLDALAENPFKVLVTFKLNDSASACLRFHPTRPILCSGNEQNGLALWDYRSKTFLLSQSALAEEATAFAWSPTAAILAAGDVRGRVKIFDSATFFNTLTFDHALSKITGLKFANNGTLLSSSLDGKIRAYDLGKGRLFREFKAERPSQILALEAEGGTGELVFGACMDPYEVCAWSLRTGELVEVFAGHTAPVHLLAFAPQAQLLLTGSWDRTLRAVSVFDRRKSQEALEFGERLLALRLSKDEKWFAVATYKNELQLFLTKELQLFALIDVSAQFVGGAVSCVEPSFDGKAVFVAGKNRAVFAVDIPHRCVVDKLNATNNREFRFSGEKLNSKFVKDGLIFSDGLYKGKQDKLILPGSKGAYQKEDAMPEFEISALGFSPDGKFLTALSSEGVLAFGEKADRVHWKIGESASKENLLALLSSGKMVDFFVSCLQLEMTELLDDLAFELPQAQIYSIVRTINREMLGVLLQFLKGKIAECMKIGSFLAWTKALILFRQKDLAFNEFNHYARFLLNFSELRMKDLVAAEEFNISALEFLLGQMTN